MKYLLTYITVIVGSVLLDLFEGYICGFNTEIN